MKRRHLPTFASMRAFDASARHGVMRAAADELSISPSAVSHQVRMLESLIGASLFERGPGKLTLTETGVAFFADLTEALDLIEAATVKASQRGSSNQITIHMESSLLELWFVPLLRDFKKIHPDIHLSVLTDPAAADLASGIVDIAIVYDKLSAKGDVEGFLLAETIAPVCTADYLSETGPIASAHDFIEKAMIWCDADPDEWQLWLNQNGVDGFQARHWIGFDLRAAALQAAREGLGVAMGRRPYMDASLAKRGLILPVDVRVPTGFGYWIAIPTRAAHLEKVKLFSRWLTKICKASDWDGCTNL